MYIYVCVYIEYNYIYIILNETLKSTAWFDSARQRNTEITASLIKNIV
jgi:hypothetical protein